MPIPQPVQVSPGSYPQINAAGIYQASGTSGAHPGPWFISRQTMEIDYVRVPVSWSETTPSILSLSAGMDRTTIPTKTQLQYIVRASFSVEKSYETFDTSSYQQGQKFKILAHEDDQYGNSYGDLSAGSDFNGSPGGTLTLGPRGKVVTEQPYYNRRPWTDADEVVWTSSGVSHTFEGCKGSFITSATVLRPDDGGVTTRLYGQNYGWIMGQFEHSLKGSDRAHTWLSDGEGNFTDLYGVPTIDFFGTYSTTQESDTAVKSWIDSVGEAIASEDITDETVGGPFPPVLTRFAKRYPQSGVKLDNTGYTTSTSSFLVAPLDNYKASRHDWS